MVHRVKGLNVDVEAVTMVGKPVSAEQTPEEEVEKTEEQKYEETDVMDDYDESMDEFLKSMGGQKEALEPKKEEE